MKKIGILLLYFTNILCAQAQTAPDFTITTTDGVTRNLYTELNLGKTILLYFFFSKCQSCFFYSPIIEQSYQNHGAGTDKIEYWGINGGFYENNATINAYKQHYGITNPCASGLQGNGKYVDSLYQTTLGFFGFPQYAIVCPNKTIHWKLNYPNPDVTGFDSFFNSCETSSRNKILTLRNTFTFPNPVKTELNIQSYKQISQVEIFNLLGEEILTRQPLSNTVKILTSNFSPGIYFIKISSHDGEFIIKQIQVTN